MEDELSAVIRVGLLYPGEMGSAVAQLLGRKGCRLLTTLEGRGPNTVRTCRAADIEELPCLREVVCKSSLLFVLVPPAAALDVAAQVREHLPSRPRDRLIYVEANSIAPATARNIAGVFDGMPVDFVDAAISGPASRLADRCVLYLSGPRADEVASLFEGKMRVVVLGDVPGQASALRMLLSGLTKGVIGLFVEMALAARQAGVLERMVAAFRTSYPGIMEVVDRTLPTYPAHVKRRGQELAEVHAMLAQLGLRPSIVPAVEEVTKAMADCFLRPADDRCSSTTEIIDELYARGFLLEEARSSASP